MATKKATKPKKATKSRTRPKTKDAPTYDQALQMLIDAKAIHAKVGTATTGINPEQLAAFLKKFAAQVANKEIHFVALNAPFKRRAPIPPA